jgi:hypothetical protein
MATTYSWEDTASGATRMTPRNRGEPSGFAQVAQPVLEQAMRRANTKDLARLKQILEQGPLAPVSVETPPIAESRYDRCSIDFATPPWVASQERGRGDGQGRRVSCHLSVSALHAADQDGSAHQPPPPERA